MDIKAITEKSSKKKGDHLNVDATVYTTHPDYIEVRIPRRISCLAVRPSSDKGVPMFTVVPRKANAEPGAVTFDVQVEQEVLVPATTDTPETTELVERTFTARMNSMNLFL